MSLEEEADETSGALEPRRGQEQRIEALVRQVWTRQWIRLLAHSWESLGEAENADSYEQTTMGRVDRTLETISCSSFDPRETGAQKEGTTSSGSYKAFMTDS